MKKVTLKEFITTVCNGILQAVLWVVGLFGYKAESTFEKVVKRIFASCVTILMVLATILALYLFAMNVVYEDWFYTYTDDYYYCAEEKHISDYIVFQKPNRGECGRLYDRNLRKTLIRGLDWVVTSEDEDSLAVFSKDGKRGYLNRFTGEVVIPFSFTKAWVFSDGLAAVEKDGKLMFIDRSGNVVIDNNFKVYAGNPQYAFKSGYCAVKNPQTGKSGLIDHKGNWALQPEYDEIFNEEGFWHVEKDKLVGLFSAEVDTLLAVEYTGIRIEQEAIEAYLPDHTAKRYDYEGNVTVDFVMDGIRSLAYETEPAYVNANRQRYCVKNKLTGQWYYGLISRNGKRITPPIYTGIDAIGKNRYLCQPQGVIIDDNGKIVN